MSTSNVSDPSKGGMCRGENDLSAISKQHSARDLPSHTRLKRRDASQLPSKDEKEMREELEEKERNLREKRTGGERYKSDSKRSKNNELSIASLASLDVDDPQDNESDDDSSNSGSNDESEDDTAELFAELNRIKKEKAAEELRERIQKKEEEERIRKENILKGNPLFNNLKNGGSSGDFKVKRRWDDDVVFKNCAKTKPNETASSFINDSLRSEFHRHFMNKYIK